MIPALLTKNKNFRKLFIAGLCSELGGFVTETAIVLHLYQISGQDPFYMGLSRGVFILLFFIGSLLGGSLSSKFAIKKILITCELIRIPLTLTLLFFKDPLTVILANSSIAFFTGVFSPNKKSFINLLVKPEETKKAQAIHSTSFAIIHLVAPIIATLLFTKIGFQSIVVFDIISYLLGSFILLSILYEKKKDLTQTSFFETFKRGMHYSFKSYPIRAMNLNGLFCGLTVGVLLSMLLPYFETISDKPNEVYGLSISLFGLGGLLGGAAFLYLLKFFKAGKIIFTSVFLENLIFLVWVFQSSEFVSLFLFLCWGLVVFIRVSGQFGLVSEIVESKLQPQVYSAIEVSFMVPNVLGALIAGFLSKTYPPTDILTVTAIFVMVITILRIFVRSTKELVKV
ncbi:MAG: MFS transporter [Bacteriovoracaceae bacterium]